MPAHATAQTGIAKIVLFAVAAALLIPAQAAAQYPTTEERCPRLVADVPPRVIRASLRPEEVRIRFIGHSTFLIESAQGVKVATDYNDYVRPLDVPDIATMNRAHSTHYTNNPDPGIKYVLKGWGEPDMPARHDFSYRDVWVRNVVTNIRDWGGGTMLHGNSIFVFETAGICIAHLGHLHHTLTHEHIDQLGRIDVVLVPVDGTFTLNTEGMVEVLKQINAPLAIPMHMFGEGTLQRFLDTMGEIYEIARSDAAFIDLTKETIPKKPKMLVLPGR